MTSPKRRDTLVWVENLGRQRSRFTHYYFYIRDETLGPMVIRIASVLPFQATYYLNDHSFIEQELKRAQIGFRKNDNAFLAVDEELVSNNLADFQLRKRLDHLHAVGPRFQDITGRFAAFQAQWLNVHVDFPLLQRLALPVAVCAVRYPGIRIHDRRVIRLLEVLLHGGSQLGGWTSKQSPPSRPHQLPPLRGKLPPEPTALRPAQAQRPRVAAARRIPMRLPAYPERRAGRTAVPTLPQTALRPARP